MSIHKIGSDLVRPPRSNDLQRGSASSKKKAGSEELVRVARADRIEISAEGRELAAEAAENGSSVAESRNEAISSRVESGFYNDPAVVEKVADRLLASGDLYSDS